MKKLKKLMTAVILVFSMAVVAAPMLPQVTNLVEAQAKTKISATEKEVYVGDSFTLKVTGAKKKKIKWSSSNPAIATVSKKGKVKAKAFGNAVITAKVGKKNYTCTVTVNVKHTFNPESYTSYELADKLENRLTDTRYGVVAEIKNISSYDLSFDATVVYYKDREVVGTSRQSSITLLKGAKTALIFNNSYTYDDYNIVFNKSVSFGAPSLISQLSVTSYTLFGNDSLKVHVRNNSGTTVDRANIALVIYDGAGNPVYCQVGHPEHVSPGEEDDITYDDFWYVDNNVLAAQNFRFFVQSVEVWNH